MATMIFMDGLGAHPETSFGELKLALEIFGHRVILVSVDGINTHEDRVERVLNSFLKESLIRPSNKIYLIGQSAGASAVRIATEKIDMSDKYKNLAGVILISPAMPRFIFALTTTLIKIMAIKLPNLLLGREITTTEEEFWALISPVPYETGKCVVTSRLPISGKEARELGFWPEKLKGYSFPTLHIYGDKDNFISPSAQVRFIKKMRCMCNSEITTFVAKGSGHAVLASKRRYEVIDLIRKWIAN